MSKAIDFLKEEFIKEYKIPDDKKQNAINGWNEYAEYNSFKDVWHLSIALRMYFYGYSKGLRSGFSDYISLP